MFLCIKIFVSPVPIRENCRKLSIKKKILEKGPIPWQTTRKKNIGKVPKCILQIRIVENHKNSDWSHHFRDTIECLENGSVCSTNQKNHSHSEPKKTKEEANVSRPASVEYSNFFLARSRIFIREIERFI